MSISSSQNQPRRHPPRSNAASRRSSMLAALCLITLASRPLTASVAVSAFQPPISTTSSSSQNRIFSTSTALFPYKPPKKTVPRAGEFELQELKVNLDSMIRQGVASRNLMPAKRTELEGYAAAVSQNMESPIPLTQLDQSLPGTRWRLTFSTQGATMGDLPPDATITLTFDADPSIQKLDYALEFSAKTLGLNAIKATSKYTVGRDGLKDAGLVTFTYDEIKTDAFGLSNLPTGFFGLLKGRANYIESVFMDDKVWIERGYSPEGEPYYNVYVKDEE